MLIEHRYFFYIKNKEGDQELVRRERSGVSSVSSGEQPPRHKLFMIKKFCLFTSVLFLFVNGLTLALAQSNQSITIIMQGEELGQLQGANVAPTKVIGSATIEAAGTGIRVIVKLNGLNPNQQSAGHIHTGKCGQ